MRKKVERNRSFGGDVFLDSSFRQTAFKKERLFFSFLALQIVGTLVSSLFSCFLVFFFFSTFDKNDIHQWRINYKNLRSGFYLQQQQTRRYGVLHSFLGVLCLTFVCYG